MEFSISSLVNISTVLYILTFLLRKDIRISKVERADPLHYIAFKNLWSHTYEKVYPLKATSNLSNEM